MQNIANILKKTAILLIGTGLFLLFWFGFSRYILPFQLKEVPYSTVLLDTNNEEIGEILSSANMRHRSLQAGDIPDFYKKALVDLEDRRFYLHPGFDPYGFGRAIISDIKAFSFIEWWSTLTMGLVRNALWLNEDRTLGKKILEILYALRVEGITNKEAILAEYANRISYGRLSVGLASAAKSYFGKEVKNLTKAECLALITMGKNPSSYDAINEEEAFHARFVKLANTLEKDGIITSDEKTAILAEKLTFPRPKNPLPYWVDAYKRLSSDEESTNLVHTTLDKNLTTKVTSLADGVLSGIAWKNVSDYAILIADRDTMKIRVLLGGANYEDKNSGQVNAVFAPRQVGSTLKPFIYLLAFKNFGLTPESTLLDLPVAYETDEGYSYEPKNYSLDYRGNITAGEALAGSVNIPAIGLTKKVWVENLLTFLKQIWVTSLDKEASYYGLSLWLGTGEISLYELLRAYSLFSKNGSYCNLVFFDDEKTECTQMVDKKYSDMIEQILTSREYKIRNFPLGSALDFSDRFAFVKTGTSRNFRDNYAIGFTDHYLIGIWTGNKDGENMKGVSGATGAGEIFGAIVRNLEQGENAPKLEGIALGNSDSKYTEITSPLEYAKYRFDPGIPENTQQIALTYRGDMWEVSHTWLLDGKLLEKEFIPLKNLSAWSHTLILKLLGKNKEVLIEKTRKFQIIGQNE